MNKITALNAACQRVFVVDGLFPYSFDHKPVWANIRRIRCQASSGRAFLFLVPELEDILAYILR